MVATHRSHGWILALCGLVAFVAGCRPGEEADGPASLAKVTPTEVSIVGAWSLFDRSTSSGFVPGQGPVRVQLDHSEQITAVKVFGHAPVRIRVAGADGSALGVPAIDLTNAGEGWHSYPTTALIGTATVELTFEVTQPGANVVVPELELWAIADGPTSVGAPTTAVDELASPFVAIAPETRSAELIPDAADDAGRCGSFAFALTRAPQTYRRVYLVYSAAGIAAPFALGRTVNGLEESGGAWLEGDATERVHADELDPTSLHLGANAVRLCAPRDATRGVAVKDVRLVVELDDGAHQVASADVTRVAREAEPARELTDHNVETTLTLALGDRMTAAFARLIAPEAIVLTGRALSPAAIASVECVDGQTTTPLATRIAPGASGESLTLLVEGSARACRGIAIQTAIAATVSDVEVIGSGARDRVDWPQVVVTNAHEHFGNRAWIGGFVARPDVMTGAVRLDVAGEAAPTMTGNFGRLLRRKEALDDVWPVAVNAAYPDGTTQQTRVLLDVNARGRRASKAAPTSASAAGAGAAKATSASSAFGSEGDSVVVRAKQLESTSIRLGSKVGLDVPVGAVAQPTDVTVRHLGEDILPPLDPGMINVTAPHGRGYEFLPHGIRFKRRVEVLVPYEPADIPEGMTAEDVHTYFFDPAQKRWQRLDRAAIDVGSQVIRSTTDHFTIMIDAVLTVPKNPTPLSYDPTALGSIAAASPTANIDLIEPPQASQTGDAHVALTLRLPQGRGAFTPSLSIAYNSSGGNGWLGSGWDLSISHIEIDTRWGVPDYAHPEAHRYLVDGAPVVPTLDSDGPTCSTGEPAQRFHPRVEGGFAHILRCGDDANHYHWEVHDRDGTLMVYGALDGDHSLATLQGGPAAGMFRWFLRSVTDVHGNRTDYRYVLEDDGTPEHGIEVYPATIEYTSHSTLPAAYFVDFVLDGGGRPDSIISGRPGFKETTRRLLRAVNVRFGSENIRSYVLEYAHGQFQKSVLSKVQVYGLGGCAATPNAFGPAGCAGPAFFHEHSFDYLQDDVGFGASTRYGVASGLQALTLSKSISYNGSLSFGSESAGVSISGSQTDRDERIGLDDINGDGLPDQLFYSGVVLFNQWHPGIQPGDYLFTGDGPQIADQITLPQDSIWSGGLSANLKVSSGGWGASLSAGFDTSVSRAKRLITDVNGDGFVDVVWAEGNLLHPPGTAELGRPCGSSMCFSSRSYAQGDLSDDPALQEGISAAQARLFVGDPVVRWVAPYTGTVDISGTVQKAGAGGTDGVSVDLYIGNRSTRSTSARSTPHYRHSRPDLKTIDHSVGDVVYLRVLTGNDERLRGEARRPHPRQGRHQVPERLRRSRVPRIPVPVLRPCRR